MARATIVDIAERVGVDKSTVSLVLRGKKGAMRISDGTQKRVFSAAKELCYRPNILARGLKGGRTHSIGIIWDMAVPQASVSMTRDLAVKLRDRQYAPYIIDNQGDITKTFEALSDFANRGVDGVGALGGGSGDARDVSSYWSSVELRSGQVSASAVCGDIDHPSPSSDITEDCVVDYWDIAAMAEHWLECTDPECI